MQITIILFKDSIRKATGRISPDPISCQSAYWTIVCGGTFRIPPLFSRLRRFVFLVRRGAGRRANARNNGYRFNMSMNLKTAPQQSWIQFTLRSLVYFDSRGKFGIFARSVGVKHCLLYGRSAAEAKSRPRRCTRPRPNRAFGHQASHCSLHDNPAVPLRPYS